MKRTMKRPIMEPDPEAPGFTLVQGLWLVALVLGAIVTLASLAQ